VEGIRNKFVGRCLSAFTCCAVVIICVGVVFFLAIGCCPPKGKQPHEDMNVDCKMNHVLLRLVLLLDMLANLKLVLVDGVGLLLNKVFCYVLVFSLNNLIVAKKIENSKQIVEIFAE
jgi:hypothetical protein